MENNLYCPYCSGELKSDDRFCPACGNPACGHVTSQQETPEQTVRLCPSCHKEVILGNKFCAFCGTPLSTAESTPVPAESIESQKKEKATRSYVFSVISTILTFLLRLVIQDDFTTRNGLYNNTYYLGIDPDMKPFISLIPAIALIIAGLFISSDKVTSSQRKTTILIVNLIFIVLSFLFIWLDIPKNIFDF